MALGAVLLVAPPAAALDGALSAPCDDVESVFARGSGQDLGEAAELRFDGQVKKRISAPLTYHSYELGRESIDGHQYPAVAVGTGSWGNFWTTVGAAFSRGGGFSYGDSVNEGVAELKAYLTERAAVCPESVFVLGGYSQGAQVIGETYNEALTDGLRDRVVYEALFGDPKLFLPEGFGPFPSACYEVDLSAWRFDVPNCRTVAGSLGARVPYLPDGYTSTTGLACANDDYVCGSSKLAFVNSGHETYANEGSSIDKAAVEIAKRLEVLFPDGGIDTSVNYLGVGTAGLDVAFLIDSTGSMGSRIGQAKAFAAQMAGTIKNLRGRVALVEYRDAGDYFTARILSGFQQDTTEFNEKLSTVTASGGGDTPEAALHALMTSFDGLDWRDGAAKAAVLLTDASYHDPDLVDGSTTTSVARRSLEIDPVNVYPVVPTWAASSYAALAEATTGQVVIDSGDTQAALTTALTRLQTRPVALLTHPDYYAPVGQQITFDASASYSPTSLVASYEWDYNGDGTFEESTSGPVATHTYQEVTDGLMQVRVTDSYGAASNASAFVHIGINPNEGFPDAPTNVAAHLTSVADGVGVAELTWESVDPNVYRWGITINGIPVGMTDAVTRSVVLSDLRLGEDIELGVVGFNKDSGTGTAATVTLHTPQYAFSGFQSPIDAAPTVNSMNAGRAVPVKFNLGGDFGLGAIAADSPTSNAVDCASSAPVSDVETTSTAGSSSWSYNQADHTYHYVWQTDSSWAGTCRVFQLKLDDGSSYEALFKFRG